jgi:hypothetical protein
MSSESPKAELVRELLALGAEAQQVLNELWAEEVIPFALNIGKITKDQDIDEYTIHFYDSRMRSAAVSLNEGTSFRDLVRAAVLDRVARMSGSLTPKPTNPN